jgi:hypothetical protein
VYLVVALFISYFLDTCIIKLFALTAEQKSYGGFAETTICSHPTDINFCVSVKDEMHNEVLAWLGLHIYKLVKLDKQILSVDFKNIQNNYCYFDGLQANTGYKK